ncbi:hypothetical protein B0T16DRAFT_515507 [Cercophora newfieldiana]|uniref:Uncharacterized protein n=1 Tax=Cercophora newfieldiana TaxID=92897 RepID=A0AA39XW39_9PEZI|nr:hypothetical protein B0T16DRAFT_515507 [Cercophora newfieldiana]
MVSFTKVFVAALFTPASCRALLRAQIRGLEISSVGPGGNFSDPNYPLDINISAGPQSGAPSLELAAARRALKKLKDLLGQDGLKQLLADDIAAGNKAWHDIVDAAQDDDTNLDPGTRTLAEVQFSAVPSDCNEDKPANFTAVNFLGWFADSAFHHADKLWKGHPEHYGIAISANSDGTMAANVTEPWGSILTDSYVPSLMPVTGQPGGGERKPWMKKREDFPYQSVGEETLQDGGVVFGHLHYAFRDIPFDGNSSKTCGIEMALNIWMPSHTPDDVRDGISDHLMVEYYNWAGWAFQDIKLGAYVPA